MNTERQYTPYYPADISQHPTTPLFLIYVLELVLQFPYQEMLLLFFSGSLSSAFQMILFSIFEDFRCTLHRLANSAVPFHDPVPLLVESAGIQISAFELL